MVNKGVWFAAGTAAVVGVAALRARHRGATTSAEPLPPSITSGYRGGVGSPLVLLHGVGGNWRVWTPVLPHLETNHEIFAPTLLGHGGAVPFADGVVPSID